MNTFKYPISSAFLAAALTAGAQTLDESIAVEGRYQAEVIRMERLSAFPNPYAVEIPRMQLDYDLAPLNSAFRPSFYPMPLPAMPGTDRRGYIDLAMGSWFDTRLTAGGWILPPDANSPWTFGAWLRHDGTSLWRWKEHNTEENWKSHHRKDCDQTLGLQASHRLANGQRLEASLAYRLHWYNYFTVAENPSQTVNSLDASVAWLPDARGPLDWRLEACYNHFAFRSMPLELPAIPGESAGEDWKAARQDVVSLSGFISKAEKGTVPITRSGLSLAGDFLGVFGNDGSYGLLTLSPAYSMTWRGVDFKAGANVDFSLKAGDAAEPFSAIHIAPELSAIYPASEFTLFVKATGGSRAQTLKRVEDVSPWVSPYRFSHCPLFVPIDASLGFNAGPATGAFRGLYGGLTLRWKAVDHLPHYGWFPLALRLEPGDGALFLASQSRLTSLHGFAAEANIGFSYLRLVDIGVRMAYAPQHGTRGFFNGPDRPRWVGEAKIESHPVNRLSLKLRANWRAVRRLWGNPDSMIADAHIPSGQEVYGLRMTDWFSLGLEAGWRLLPDLEIGVGAYNLTDRCNFALPGLPVEGVAVAGKVSWEF